MLISLIEHYERNFTVYLLSGEKYTIAKNEATLSHEVLMRENV
ncbi:hypothetical protein MRX60_12760 (plasmid) [Xylella fastidiosa subsp. pauca]|nr:hypothetical protein [Xylella fastidiosa]MDG5826869.1 hypothetical protein [Xylella fastidiosa subsp. pauca]MDG5826904.1 hypothetical protein [Xylella fastidiosa subsp. pauca]